MLHKIFILENCEKEAKYLLYSFKKFKKTTLLQIVPVFSSKPQKRLDYKIKINLIN